MKKIFHNSAFTLLLAVVLSGVAVAQVVTPETDVELKKRAQTGMKFLSMSVDARSTAIGGAVMAETNGSSVSMFYNPASMAGMKGNFHANFSNMAFITDIAYNVASVAFKPSGNIGVFGVSVMAVDYGDFIGTVRANNEAGFLETGTYSPTAMSVGLGYARSLTDRFSVGGHVKVAYQNIGDGFVTSRDFGNLNQVAEKNTADYAKQTLAVDFGVIYETGFKSLVIAMAARNFARELTYVRERYELPLTFQIGAQINVLDFTSLNPDTHTLMLHADASRPRDFSEHIKFGLEYGFMNILYLRGGFENYIMTEQGVSLGAGVNIPLGGIRFGADYAYTDWGLFGTVNRVGVNIGL